MSRGQQLRAGLDPLNPDTDNDGLSDGAEGQVGLSPLLPDSDSDGLPDGEELRIGVDPLGPDTDGDGVCDGLEVALGRSPSQAEPIPAPRLRLPHFSPPAMASRIVTAQPVDNTPRRRLAIAIPILCLLWWGAQPKTRRALCGVINTSDIHRP